jgi:hypothetical protein
VIPKVDGNVQTSEEHLACSGRPTKTEAEHERDCCRVARTQKSLLPFRRALVTLSRSALVWQNQGTTYNLQRTTCYVVHWGTRPVPAHRANSCLRNLAVSPSMLVLLCNPSWVTQRFGQVACLLLEMDMHYYNECPSKRARVLRLFHL